MIKVPATKPGVPAIRQLIAERINVNITLLFSQKVYEEVVEAYLGGLEHFVGRGGDPSQLASIASFFVNAAALAGADGTPWDTSERISSVSVRATTALLAYIERNKFNLDRLQEVRLLIRKRKRVGTCLGVGPRLLHSTGQAYKGGPSTGVFL